MTTTSRRCTRRDAPSRRHIRKYTCQGENQDDLEQVASLRLILAVDRFDPDRRTDFPLLDALPERERTILLLRFGPPSVSPRESDDLPR